MKDGLPKLLSLIETNTSAPTAMYELFNQQNQERTARVVIGDNQLNESELHSSATSKRVYFEARLKTTGQIRLGLLLGPDADDENTGAFDGSSANAVVLDGASRKLLHAGVELPHSMSSWEEGDIIGFLADLSTGELFVYHNGVSITEGAAFSASKADASDAWAAGIIPAAHLGARQRVVFNFGQERFAFAPAGDHHSFLEAFRGPRPTIRFQLRDWRQIGWQVHDRDEFRALVVPDDRLQLADGDVKAAQQRLLVNHTRQVARGLNAAEVRIVDLSSEFRHLCVG